MKDYARQFYKSKKWITTSRLYMMQHHYICERCGAPASICHHRRYLTPDNINDAYVALDPRNLECLCQDCHNREHFAEHGATAYDDSLVFNEAGDLIKI